MNLKKCIAQIPYLASIFVLLLFWLPATAGEQEDVQATINGQCQAFLEDDVTRAFTYASPSIRSIFETPQNFGESPPQTNFWAKQIRKKCPGVKK